MAVEPFWRHFWTLTFFELFESKIDFWVQIFFNFLSRKSIFSSKNHFFKFPLSFFSKKKSYTCLSRTPAQVVHLLQIFPKMTVVHLLHYNSLFTVGTKKRYIFSKLSFWYRGFLLKIGLKSHLLFIFRQRTATKRLCTKRKETFIFSILSLW